MGDAHVLLFASHERGVQYYVGELDGERFVPRRHGRMNFAGFSLVSGTLCAALTLRDGDGDGRRVMFGWVTEGRSGGRPTDFRLVGRDVSAAGAVAGR